MACFTVPAVEALIVTAVCRPLEKRAEEQKKHGIEVSGRTTAAVLLEKRKWLTNLLWGGTVLLLFEHIWHGEIIPYFPFLTAAYNAADTAEMLHEMMTVGTAMSASVTLIWLIMVGVSEMVRRRDAVSVK
ncbi:MAG: hypothetical protein EOM64_03120 [Erysipelotrichia bacterium]|nr:hypothetical protein [Erysipelotrichia bacterium]